MINAERQEKIKEYVYANKYANINELAELFQTSTATIRRCLKQLEAEHVVEMVRNGAVLVSDGTTFEKPYLVKRQQNGEEKRRIAQAAASYLHTGDSVFLDSSSTVFEMIGYLRNLERLTVSTNDVMIASTLSPFTNLSVMVIGGLQRQGFYTLTGCFAESCMEQVHVDFAFLGVVSISPNGHFMITNSEEVGIKRAILWSANTKIVLCDHTKFNHTAFMKLWEAQDVDLVITGRELDDATYEAYQELGLKIQRV